MTEERVYPRSDAEPDHEPEPSRFRFVIGSASERSDAREEQDEPSEDAMFDLPLKRAAGVFDGLGGLEGGDYASKLAADTIRDYLDRMDAPAGDVDAHEKILRDAVDLAHRLIAAEAAKRNVRMGTTGVVTMLVEQADGTATLLVAHVGDSRAWQLHEGKLRALTIDDATWLLDFASADRLQVQEAAARDENARHAPAVTQHLGMQQVPMELHVSRFPVSPGDRFLLTTDGVHDPLPTGILEHVLKRSTPQEAAEALVSSARGATALGEPRAKDDDRTAKVVDV